MTRKAKSKSQSQGELDLPGVVAPEGEPSLPEAAGPAEAEEPVETRAEEPVEPQTGESVEPHAEEPAEPQADEAPPGSGEVHATDEPEVEHAQELTRAHLRGLLEALVFASDKPVTSHELARLASAPLKQVKEMMAELSAAYRGGITLAEVAGGWLFRTGVQYAPFVRDLAGGRPVRLSRAQIETLAIAAYRQPITRPEIDEIRGVDSGATLKLLLERDLLRILGKKDEPGRPLLYGTTTQFLEFFGMKSLKDLPTLREFTELSDDSRRVAEAELGDVLPPVSPPPSPPADAPVEASEREPIAFADDFDARDTLPPPPAEDSVSDLDAIPNLGMDRPSSNDVSLPDEEDE